MAGYGTDVLVLRGHEIEVTLADLPQANLRFYLDNPRLYTLVRADSREPTQDEIEERLSEMDHVKHLVHSIKENGGLIDAVIVQGKTHVVLEGNSRLAAYRILAKQDPIKWGKIKAKVLPESISEGEVFSLLGEYHIIGKKDWAPFEQAGYLYRRHKNHNISIDTLSSEIHISKRLINHLISVYQFMLDSGEKNVNRWSYYDEYLKSNIIKRAREKHPQMDALVVKKIRSGEIPRAVDIRDDLKKIADAGGNVLDRFATGKKSFTESVNAANNKGAGNQGVRSIKRFKEWLALASTQQEIAALEGDTKKECAYELNKIETLVSRMLKKLT